MGGADGGVSGTTRKVFIFLFEHILGGEEFDIMYREIQWIRI